MSHVFDASALLAAILEEPGASDVEHALPAAIVSAVNIAEAVSALVNRGMPAERARETIAAIELTTLPADRDQAIDAGVLRGLTARAGLSLGDRFCLSLARRLGMPVLTADAAWTRIAGDVGVEVRLIR